MKQFLNFFYIMPFKMLVLILIVITALLCNSQITQGVYLFKQDRLSVMNVFLQNNDFDYYSSTYLKNEIETAINDVVTYSMKYAIDENDPHYEVKTYVDSQDFDKYTKYMNNEFKNTVTRLRSHENFYFAFVNHRTEKIVSNMLEINGESSSIEIRPFFNEHEKNLLVVYSAQKPYFEKGTMTEYVSFVNELSENYEDDFDLYISFNDELKFSTSAEEFQQRHNQYKPLIQHSTNNLIFFMLILLVLSLLFLYITGKHEHKGKCILSSEDKIPNDLKFSMVCLIFFSMMSLYQISIYMMVRPEQSYFFARSTEFYSARSSLCFTVMTLIVLSACSIIKKQHSHKILLSNTYIYQFITRFKESRL